MSNILKEIKENVSWVMTILAAIIGASVAYGSQTAFQNSDHKMLLEDHDVLIKVVQHVDDLWHDNGHKD